MSPTLSYPMLSVPFLKYWTVIYSMIGTITSPHGTLFCTALYHTALPCTKSQCASLQQHSNTYCFTARHFSTLCFSALHSSHLIPFCCRCCAVVAANWLHHREERADVIPLHSCLEGTPGIRSLKAA